MPQTDDEKILDLLSSVGEITTKDVQKRLKVSRATALRRVDELIENGLLEKTGKTRAIRYRLKKANS